ncbi:MAG: ribose 5-phosphate isomerase B [Acidobacteria bacterium]|nr:ribose 5-phosphate isomerase B [Acidobacteriota bacterium]
MSKPVLTEAEVRQLEEGSPCYVLKGTLITALARELAASRQNEIIECGNRDELEGLKSTNRRIALGADHRGYALKVQLKVFLKDAGYQVLDCGAQNQESVDYPDLALKVAVAVKTGQALLGIMVDGVGIGSCMVANKVPGIRAAHCYDRLTARNSREHNDANVLTLGSEVLQLDQATLIVSTWLNTPFASGRHQRRVSKIDQTEQQFLKDTVAAVAGDCSWAL